MAISVPVERPLTANDLASFPDDGNRYEVIGGILEVSPSPSFRHQWISQELARTIGNYFAANGEAILVSAPMDVYLGINDQVQPDVIVIARTRTNIVREPRIEGAPDLVIEILSSTSRGRDLIAKSALYARVSIAEYWVVDPEHSTISLGVLSDGRYVYPESPDGLARSQRFPGLVLDPREVFRMPDWDQTEPSTS